MSRQLLVFTSLLSMVAYSNGYGQNSEILPHPPFDKGVPFIKSKTFKTDPVGSSPTFSQKNSVKPAWVPSSDRVVFENQEIEMRPRLSASDRSTEDRMQINLLSKSIRVVRHQSDTLITDCFILVASVSLSIGLVALSRQGNNFFKATLMSSSAWVDLLALAIILIGTGSFLGVFMLPESPVGELNIQLRGWSATSFLIATLIASVAIMDCQPPSQYSRRR